VRRSLAVGPSWGTHGLDLAYKIAVETLSLGLGLGVLAAAYVANSSDFYLLSPLTLTAAALVLLALYAAFRAVLVRTVLPPWAPTYLYVNLSLGAAVTVREARLLAFMFDGSLQGRWYPMTSVRRLPRAGRRAALFDFARRLQAPPPEREPRVDPSGSPPPDPMQAHLQVLGLAERPADLANLKRAFRRKMAAHHPDRFATDHPEARAYAEDLSKRITGAYAALARTYPAGG
jgi:hypothetical protein